jgi:hypothetical protein
MLEYLDRLESIKGLELLCTSRDFFRFWRYLDDESAYPRSWLDSTDHEAYPLDVLFLMASLKHITLSVILYKSETMVDRTLAEMQIDFQKVLELHKVDFEIAQAPQVKVVRYQRY